MGETPSTRSQTDCSSRRSRSPSVITTRAARLLLGLLLDRHRLADLLDVSENAVDLRGADADAAHIEDPIGTAVQPPTAMGRGLDQIAMRPEAGVLGEIGGMEARAVGVTVETEGARRERVGADQLADPRLRIIRRRQRADIEAEASALRLVAMDWQGRI